MTQESNHGTFMVWASDHIVYGPVDLAALSQWVKDGRVLPQTWILTNREDRWCRAETIPPLGPLFSKESPRQVSRSATTAASGVLVAELRQFAAFSAVSNQQLEQFVEFGQLLDAPAGCIILRRHDPSDSVFFLLSGELRARVMMGYEDKTLGQIKAGECFGETAMFMRIPRTADVVAESDARMLRVTSEAFLQLIDQLPHVAAPILFGMARVMAGRVTDRNQQFQRDVASGALWR